MLPMLSFRYFRIKDSKHRKLNFKDLQSPRILVQAMEWSVLVFGTKYCTMRDIPEKCFKILHRGDNLKKVLQ